MTGTLRLAAAAASKAAAARSASFATAGKGGFVLDSQSSRSGLDSTQRRCGWTGSGGQGFGRLPLLWLALRDVAGCKQKQ